MQEVFDPPEKLKGVKILAFDLYDTLVDLEGTIEQKVERLQKGVKARDFAKRWREQYGNWMDEVRKKNLTWTPLEELIGIGLNITLAEFGLNNLTSDEKNSLKSAWTSPIPYPDSREGLERLQRKGFVLATMSNASEATQRQIAKSIGIEFDHYFSSDSVETFKPAPEFFQQALGWSTPQQIMMVAESASDLNGAAAEDVGFKTAYIHRIHRGELPTGLTFNIVVRNIQELADKLGA